MAKEQHGVAAVAHLSRVVRSCYVAFAVVAAATLAQAAGAQAIDPRPAIAVASPRLLPLPAELADACRQAQRETRTPLLCPRRLPRATLRDLGFPPPALVVDVIRDRGEPIGFDFGYGGAREPGPADWREHLWRNRPCCFLHFEVYRRTGGDSVPSTATAATLGGRRGLFKPAAGWGLACPADGYLYWCNHAAFLWSERGISYVATLHHFGGGTRELLGRLVAELGAADAVPAPSPRGSALATSPGALLEHDGDVWIGAVGDRDRPGRGTIFRIDGATGRVVAELRPGPAPRSLVAVSGRLWAATAEQVVIVELARNRLRRLDVGRWPRAVAVGAGGPWVVTSLPWLERGQLVRLDAATGAVRGRVTLGRAPVAAATGAGSVWVVDELDAEALRVDPLSERVSARVRVGDAPTSVAVGAGAVWVANTGDRTVTRIDPATNAVAATIEVGAAPRGLTFARGALWLAATGDGTVARVDPTDNSVSIIARDLGDPLAVAVGDHRIWVTTNDGALHTIDVRGDAAARSAPESRVPSVTAALTATAVAAIVLLSVASWRRRRH